MAGLTASSPVPFIPTFNGPGLINNATLAPKVDFPASGQLVRGTAADLDGDGKPDIAVANAGQNKVSIKRNTSTPGTIDASSFAGSLDISVGTTPFQVIACDFNGDGKLDLAHAATTQAIQSLC